MAVSCSKKPNDAVKTTPPLQTTKPILHVYTWSNYFDDAVLSEFEEAHGVKVQLSYYSSNEEMIAKLQAGARGYDVIVPSSYVIRTLKALDLLVPVDVANWTEIKDVDSRFTISYLDEQKTKVTSVPLNWGSSGLAFDSTKIKEKVDSWAWVFDHPEFKGQMTMLDDSSTVIGVALKYLGYSLNETSPAALQKAKALLKKQKTMLKAYTSEPKPLLVEGEVVMAQIFSSDLGQILAKHPQWKYVRPKEGGEIWVDHLAIPKGSAQSTLAMSFIRHMLSKKTQTEQSIHLFTYPVVKSVASPWPESMRPTEKTYSKFEFSNDDPERHEVLQRLWTELKAE